MKSAREWITERRNEGKIELMAEFIRHVQRDALEAAAEVCDRNRGEYMCSCCVKAGAEIRGLKP